MMIMAILTILRLAKDVGSDDLGDIVDRDAGNDDHDGAVKAFMSMTFTRTFTRTFKLLRHVEGLSS